MGLSIVGIKLIEEAIEKELYVGIMANGKIVLGDNSAAEVLVKAHKTDKVSDIYQRLSGRNKPYVRKPKTQIVKNYYNSNHYNTYGNVDDGFVARGVTLVKAPNRYT